MEYSKILKVCACLLIFLVVMITPACAVEMEDVAHQAEKYNEESKKKHGFFGKIKLIAKGFKLVDTSKKAEKESEKKKKELQGENGTDGDLFRKNEEKILDNKNLLKYRNRGKAVNNTDTSNPSSNSTNGTLVVPSLSIIPQACVTHIDGIIKFLVGQGLQVSYTQNNGIDSSLIGKIVQIIDPNGNIHYVQILSLTNTSVIMNTGTGNREYSLDEFTKSFTGITIKTNNDPQNILEQINNKEQTDLNQAQTQAQTIHDKARNQVIQWGILIGVSVVLIILGVILTMVFGSQLIASAKAAPKYAARYTSVEAEEGILNEVNNDVNRPKMTGRSTLENVLRHLYEVKNQEGITLFGDPINEFISCYAYMGVEITVLTAAQLVIYVTTQNWVKVVLCIVGLILVLAGIGLLIGGIIKTVKNALKWHRANLVTQRNKKDINNLKEWISINNTNILQNTTKNSTNLIKN